jgi:hypothetical protein
MAHACISRLLCHYLAYLSLLTVQLAAFGPHLCLLSVVWQALLDGLVCQVLCQHKTHCVKLMAGVKVSYMLKWCVGQPHRACAGVSFQRLINLDNRCDDRGHDAITQASYWERAFQVLNQASTVPVSTQVAEHPLVSHVATWSIIRCKFTTLPHQQAIKNLRDRL